MRRIFSSDQSTIDTQFSSLVTDDANGDVLINQLFAEYWQPLYRFSYNLLHDEDDAQDVVQEIFISLWDRRSDLDIHSSIESYLFTSVRYKSLTRLSSKLKKGRRDLPLEDFIEESFRTAVDPTLVKELQEEIEVEICRLPVRMQQVLRMRTMQSMTISEIAQNLNISEDTVKNHLAAARKKLKMRLSDGSYFVLLMSIYLG